MTHIDQSKIRNFCIVAHIDHGKSTLADRIIERTGLLTEREMQALVLAVILFSRRMVKARGFRAWQILLWLLIAAAIGGAGYMEYYVQRRGNEALFAYSVMSGCFDTNTQ